jgi:hypothetical protein
VSQRRVIRVISYEGIDSWVDDLLCRSPLNGGLRTRFHKSGTVKELQRVELGDGESIVIRKEGCETPAR